MLLLVETKKRTVFMDCLSACHFVQKHNDRVIGGSLSQDMEDFTGLLNRDRAEVMSILLFQCLFMFNCRQYGIAAFQIFVAGYL